MMPLVVRLEDLTTHAVHHYAFIKSPVRIGRSELNDLPLPFPFVSTWHALVQFDEHKAWYVDLGSTNGSVLRGERLAKNAPAPLEGDTEVVIGTLKLAFSRRSTQERPVTRAQTMFALRASALRLPVPGAAPAEAPAPAPPPPEPSAEAIAAADQALSAAGMDLDLLFAEYRGTWQHLRSAIERAVEGLSGDARAAALSQVRARYPAVAGEPQFVELSGGGAPVALEPLLAPIAAAPPAAAAAPSPVGEAAVGLLAAFGESYLPAGRGPATPDELKALLERTADALEACARSYVEMRKGYEEFGKEMGVRTIQGDGPVERARDARQLLAWILDLKAEGRAPELQRAFADLMVHQVALVSGVRDGARALLERLGPEAVGEDAPQSVWPMKAAALWRAYEARWHELADEEDALSDALFGQEFARAYSAIAGQRGGDAEGGMPPRPGRRER